MCQVVPACVTCQCFDLGFGAKWRHRLLLLKSCVATAILLTLLGDRRMREVG